MPWIDAAGIRLHCAIDGAEGAPVVLLLHGIDGSGADWESVSRALAAEFRVLRVDLPDHGRSAPPPEPGLCRVERLAETLAALLDALAIDRAYIGGHAFGGMVAQALAIAAPARLRGLILADTTPEPLLDPWTAQLLELEEEADAEPNGTPGTTSGRDAAYAQALLAWPGCVSALETIAAPTLVLVGEAAQPYLQRGAEMLHGWIPASRLVRVPGARGAAHLEQPAAFTATTLAFLREAEAFRRANEAPSADEP